MARVLTRFGVPARAVFPAGGVPGTTLVSELEREAIRVVPLTSDADTRQAVTLWVRLSGEHYRVLVDGRPLAVPVAEACLAALEAVAPAPRFVVLSGSLPPGLPVGVVARAAALARRRGARFICDSSGAALAAAVEAGADLVKPSRRELRELVGERVALERFDHERAARAAVARGARAVAVSLGPEGAFLATAEGVERRFPSPPVEVVSSVGAGDSMVAGIVLGLLRGWPLAAAVRLGVAAGAAACITHGSELCRPGDVERLDRELAAAGPDAAPAPSRPPGPGAGSADAAG